MLWRNVRISQPKIHEDPMTIPLQNNFVEYHKSDLTSADDKLDGKISNSATNLLIEASCATYIIKGINLFHRSATAWLIPH